MRTALHVHVFQATLSWCSADSVDDAKYMYTAVVELLLAHAAEPNLKEGNDVPLLVWAAAT